MQETTVLILDSLRLIEDPRVNRTKRHSLELLLFVAVCRAATRSTASSRPSARRSSASA